MTRTSVIIPQCSVSCGNGKKERTVECSGGRGKCDSRNKPQPTTSCNAGRCPEWKVGDWSQVKFIRRTYFEGRGNFNVTKWMWKHFIQMSPNIHLVNWSFSYVQKIWIPHYQRPIINVFFHSVQCLVEMERGNAQWNVVEEKESVTAKQSHKPQQAVILVHVRSGKLENGVRYINSEQVFKSRWDFSTIFCRSKDVSLLPLKMIT